MRLQLPVHKYVVLEKGPNFSTPTTINSINVNCANNMQNPKLGDANFSMSTTYCNDHDWGDSSYDNENLFKPHDEYDIDNSVCNNI